MFSFISKLITKQPTFEETLDEQLSEEVIRGLQGSFLTLISESRVEFKKYIATYFSYTVLTEGDNSLNADLKLADYPSVKELLKERTLIKYPEDPTATLSESFSIITWEKQMETYIEYYVKERIEEACKLYLSTQPELTALYQSEGVVNLPHKAKVLKHLKWLISENTYRQVIKDYKESLYLYQPETLFKHGLKQAEHMLNTSEQAKIKMEKDFSDLAESIFRVNKLYTEVATMFKATFKQSLPKGKLDYPLYNERYKLVLLNLKNKDYPVERVRELATLDTKYTPEVIRAITSFKYQ